VIEDLDGGDVGPSRAPFIRAISLALVVSAAIGWAALQQPALRGPYATPDPSGGVAFTERASSSPAPKLFVIQYLQSGTAASTFSCLVGQSQQSRTGYGFVGGRSVTLIRELDVNVWAATSACQPESAAPEWQFAP